MAMRRRALMSSERQHVTRAERVSADVLTSYRCAIIGGDARNHDIDIIDPGACARLICARRAVNAIIANHAAAASDVCYEIIRTAAATPRRRC